MVSIFKQKSPANIIVLFIVGLLLKAPLFIHPRLITTTSTDAELYRWMIRQLSSAGNQPALLFSVVSLLLLFVQALLTNHLVNQYRLLPKVTYLPAMAYLLITSLLPEWNYLSAPLVAATVILIVFIKLFKVYNIPNARSTVFTLGILCGLSSYIYFPSACFVICVLLGLVILKPFRLNEVVLFLLGCLLPYYFYGSYLFLVNGLSLAAFVPHVSVKVPVLNGTIWLAVALSLLVVPFLPGGFYIQAHLHKMLIQVRKSWSIVLLYLLLGFFVPFVNTFLTFSNWVLVAAPFACFHASLYYYLPKLWVANAIFFVFVACLVYLQYFSPLWRQAL